MIEFGVGMVFNGLIDHFACQQKIDVAFLDDVGIHKAAVATSICNVAGFDVQGSINLWHGSLVSAKDWPGEGPHIKRIR